MNFGYAYEKTGGNVLEVEDIFNTSLRLTTYTEQYFYLVTSTKHGYTCILTAGPLPIEGEYIGKNSSINFKKVSSDTKKVKMEIDRFINDYKKSVQLVEEITEDELYTNCMEWNLLDYMKRDEK